MERNNDKPDIWTGPFFVLHAVYFLGQRLQKRLIVSYFYRCPKYPPKLDHDLEMIRVVTATEHA
jgi:hypothetical protein